MKTTKYNYAKFEQNIEDIFRGFYIHRLCDVPWVDCLFVWASGEWGNAKVRCNEM